MCTVTVIGGRSGTLSPCLLGRIAESRRAGRRTVLYVPEQYTLQAERELIEGLRLPGLLDLDVVSPRKLRRQVAANAGTDGRRALDDYGRAMAVHRAVTECGDSLQYYRHITDLYGAVSEMGDALDELRESGMTAEELESLAEEAAGGAEKAKFRDLAMLWRAYDALIASRFDDTYTAWTETCSRLEASRLLDGTDLYVYGFDTVRPDLCELLLRAARVCASVTVTLVMAPESAPDGRIFAPQRESAARLTAEAEAAGVTVRTVYPELIRENIPDALRALESGLFADERKPYARELNGVITLYAAATPYTEAQDAVSTLTAWHGEGIPWDRMAVALPKNCDSGNMLAALLTANGIPFFYSRRDRAARSGVCRMLKGALRFIGAGSRSEDILAVAKSGFSTLTADEGMRLELYAQSHGVDRGKWHKPFTRGEDAAEAEALRQKLLAPVDALHDALRAARTATASVEAVVRFLEAERVYPQLKERQQLLIANGLYQEAVVERQVWKQLMNLLDQLWALLGERRAGMKEMAGLISNALEKCEISGLPEDGQGVNIGTVGHMLPGETDALILMGMNEGAVSAGDGGLLSDRERRTVREITGRTVGLDRMRQLMIVRSDYYRTLTLPGRRLRITRSMRSEDGGVLQPDMLIHDLKRLFPRLTEEGSVLADGRPPRPVTPAIALEGLTVRLRDIADGKAEDLDGEWKSAFRALWRDEKYGPLLYEAVRRVTPREEMRRIDAATARALFRADSVSISRLERFAGCPYAHFIRYGLRPVQPGAFEFGYDDEGNFYHAALERYLRAAGRDPAWPDLDDGKIGALMDGILDGLTAEWEDGPLTEDACGRWTGDTYRGQARRAARTLTRFAGNSDFRTVATELAFGMDGSDVPPVILTLRDGARVALGGKIDRVDEYRGPEGTYLRVVDYKSGTKKLEPGKMLTGEQLQLMLYLKAVTDAKPGVTPAGAFYFPVRDGEVDLDTDDPEKLEDKRLAGVRMSGVLLADPDVARAADRDRSPYSLPQVFNKDGTVRAAAGWALEEKDLRALMDAAAGTAAELCERIRDGEVGASPAAEDGKSVCTFCEYRGACRTDKAAARMRDKDATFRDAAAKKPLRE